MEYAKDALLTDKPWRLWQVKTSEADQWRDAWKELEWDSRSQYRRKPKTININGFEVPEPMRDAPARGSSYFYAELISGSDVSWWSGDGIDYMRLAAGMVHATPEAAELHSKALRSFTEVKE
jgi:hypothetical protein